MTNPYLFDQASNQLNFLLLSQRNMILVSAFAVALATFSTNQKKYRYFKYLILMLFIFAIASGAKSASDFSDFIKKTRDETVTPALTSDEKELLERWEQWLYFSYTLLGIISFIFTNYLYNEFVRIN